MIARIILAGTAFAAVLLLLLLAVSEVVVRTAGVEPGRRGDSPRHLGFGPGEASIVAAE